MKSIHQTTCLSNGEVDDVKLSEGEGVLDKGAKTSQIMRGSKIKVCVTSFMSDLGKNISLDFITR